MCRSDVVEYRRIWQAAEEISAHSFPGCATKEDIRVSRYMCLPHSVLSNAADLCREPMWRGSGRPSNEAVGTSWNTVSGKPLALLLLCLPMFSGHVRVKGGMG